METRKLQIVGNRSYAVSLPKEWIKTHKLKQQDTVFVDINQRKNIEISSIKKTGDVKEFDINVDEIENIKEFIVFCYEKNIDRLILRSKLFDVKRTSEIRQILTYLDGYEIIHEDPKHIEVSFLFKDIDVTLPKIKRRMIYLIKLMIEQLQHKEYTMMCDTETTTDKLYHLSKRIIFSCLDHYNRMVENEIFHEEDLIFTKDVLKRLENIADKILELAQIKITAGDTQLLFQLIGYIDDLLNKNVRITDVKKNILAITIPRGNPSGAVLHRIQDLSIDIVENYLSIYFNNKYFK